MKIYEDGREINVEFQAEDTLEKVISTLDQKADSEKKIVSSITVDDVVMHGGNEVTLNSKLIRDIKKLEVVLEEEKVLVLRALEESAEYLPQLAQGLDDISLLFQAGNRNEAFDKFTQCLNGWIQIIQLLRSLEKIRNLDYSGLTIEDGTSVKENNTKLLGLLEETKVAMENDDIVALSDLIEYELSPIAQKQVEVVRCIISAVQQGE